MENESPLYYIERGSGNCTLVFLHYFGGSSGTWKPVMERLDKRFRCLAIDLPGFGSSPPLAQNSVANTATVVAALFKKLSLRNYVLVGHSMGGKVALSLAARQPQGLNQLVLIAPSPPTPEPMDDEKRKELAEAYGDEKALRKITEGLTAGLLTEGELKTLVDDDLRVHRSAWDGWINTGSREDISAQMKTVRVPLTIISGKADPNFSPRFLQTEFMRWFSEVTFIELSDSGHLLPVESAQHLASVISDLYNS